MAKAVKSAKPFQSGPAQSFKVLRPIKHNGDVYAPDTADDEISIDKETFDILSAAAAIEGEWQDEAAPAA